MNDTAKRIFELIEEKSSVIDWEDDLGVMREMKEEDYQAIKSEFEGK